MEIVIQIQRPIGTTGVKRSLSCQLSALSCHSKLEAES